MDQDLVQWCIENVDEIEGPTTWDGHELTFDHREAEVEGTEWVNGDTFVIHLVGTGTYQTEKYPARWYNPADYETHEVRMDMIIEYREVEGTVTLYLS